jgi:hypothetical protein
MSMQSLRELLESIRNGNIDPQKAEGMVRDFFYRDLGHTKIDTYRRRRTGYPEVIYCSGKTTDQIMEILSAMGVPEGAEAPPPGSGDGPLLLTRLDEEKAAHIIKRFPSADWNPLARTMCFGAKLETKSETFIAVITAGTSDLPVAEEAAVTAEVFGNRVERISDVGVAGIHRLMDKLELIRAARVLVVAAGMEGALPSVVAGLVDKPVVAVPTSVGYGANFGGLSALLSMLNSCSTGIGVVNIDNGFGAGYLAGMINTM